MKSKKQIPGKLNKPLVYTTSFVAGFVILSLEVLGFRLFAPFFGYSIYVSGSLISMVLIALSAGYYLGGKLADKRPELLVLYRYIMIATAYLVLITLTYKNVLGILAIYSPVTGSIFATVIIFGFPMVILSMVPPFLVKILVKSSSPQKVGSIVGTISALSTLGSIAGSLLTTFILIPWLGSKNTFILCDLSLFLIALIYLVKRGPQYLIAVVLPLLLIVQATVTHSRTNAVFEKESAYNLIKVTYQKGFYFLHLNREENVQSVYNPDRIYTKTYYDMMNVGPVIAGGKDVLIIGLGGGASANQMKILFDANVEGVEIDPDVVSVAEKYFLIRQVNPDIKVHVMDGRAFLRNSDKQYDVIELDVYHGGFYIPFHIVTQEFFNEVNEHLKPNGVLVMNVLSINTREGGQDLFHYIANTMTTSFESVFSIELVESNMTVIATKSARDLAAVKARISESPLMENDDMGTAFQYAYDHISAYEYNPAFGIFTDDRAPIEEVTYKMLKLGF